MYSKDEIGKVICERIALGESLNAICKGDDMPDKATVIRWALDKSDAENKDAFCNQYARARQIQAELRGDEILDIADDSTGDIKEINGRKIVDYENIARSRLKVDTRKWYLSKVLPKVYGDKLALTGDDGGALKVQWVINDNNIHSTETTS